MKSSEERSAYQSSRRNFIFTTAAASAATLGAASTSRSQSQTPPGFSALKPLGDRVHPITPDEFHARLLHAQELMGQLNPKFDALLLGPGTSLYYFTGIRWHLSERLLALVIPRSGQPILISPVSKKRACANPCAIRWKSTSGRKMKVPRN